MEKGPENPNVIALIAFLEKASRKNKAPVWKQVAGLLQKPSRKKGSVNLYEIDKHAKEGETIIVPSKLLGIGKLSKKITIAAASFSASAKAAIEKAGSKIVSIKKLAETNPKGSKTRIIV